MRASDDALEAIATLTRERGRVMFFQSGGCCDGSSPSFLLDVSPEPPEGFSLAAGRDRHFVTRAA